MKRTWSNEEKVSILNEAKTFGVVETCLKHGIFATTYYSWKEKHNQGREDGLRPGFSKQEHKDMKRLEKENERLKKCLPKRYGTRDQKKNCQKKIELWKSAKR